MTVPNDRAQEVRQALHWLLDLLADRVAQRLIAEHERNKSTVIDPHRGLTGRTPKGEVK